MSQRKSPFKDFEAPDAMEVGAHTASLEDIDVFAGKDKDGEEYQMLIYKFQNAEGQEATKWVSASWGPKSENRAFVLMLSGKGIPASAMENKDSFWEYSQTLCGKTYNISVVIGDNGKPTVAAAMPIAASDTKATTKAGKKSAPAEPASIDDDGIPF